MASKYRLPNVATSGRFYGLNPRFTHYSLRFAGSTIFKVFAPYDEERKALTPLLDGGDIGDWLRIYPVVRLRIGEYVTRFIPYNPCLTQTERNPILILQRAVAGLKSQHIIPETWKYLFDRTKDPAMMTVMFDPIRYLCVAAILFSNQEAIDPPFGSGYGNTLVMLELSKTAGDALHAEAVRSKVNLFDPHVVVEAVPVAGGALPGGKMQYSQYRLNFLKRDDLMELPAQKQILEDELSWDRILSIPSVEDQMQLLCNSAIPYSAIVYAFGETELKDLIPEQVLMLGKKQLEYEFSAMSQGRYGGGPGQPYGMYQGFPAEAVQGSLGAMPQGPVQQPLPRYPAPARPPQTGDVYQSNVGYAPDGAVPPYGVAAPPPPSNTPMGVYPMPSQQPPPQPQPPASHLSEADIRDGLPVEVLKAIEQTRQQIEQAKQRRGNLPQQ